MDQGLKLEGVGAEWKPALRQLFNLESFGGNPLAQNPKSTAFGMFQFLDSTWEGYGIPKTSDPVQQMQAGIRYIKARYGTPERAVQFRIKNGWY